MFVKQENNLIFISMSGKLWVHNAPYHFDVDDYLRDNEELYIINKKLKYRTTINDVTVEFRSLIVMPGIGRFEAIDALRKISTVLVEHIEGVDKIIVDKDFIKTEKDGEQSFVQELYLVQDDDHGTIVYLSKEIFDKYGNFFEEAKKNIASYSMRSETTILPMNEYYLEIFAGNVYLGKNDLAKDYKLPDPMDLFSGNYTPVFLLFDEPEEFSGEHILILKSAPVKISSPQTIPDNAFIISKSPQYIQFTKNGVVISDGIYFVDEKLEEVRLPWYIVDKGENGWEIYLYSGRDYLMDGYYRIIGSKLIKDFFDEDFSNTDNLLYIDRNTEIIKEEDKILEIVKDNYAESVDEIPVSEIERTKISIGDRIIWVPKAMLKNFLHL